MRISPQWLREIVEIKVSDGQLADDLTLAGIAVESIKTGCGPQSPLFEMEIGTNRPDAMCHYGVARECSAVYDIDLKQIKPRLPKPKPASTPPFAIEIEDTKGCLRFTARVVRGVKIAASPKKILERLAIDDHGGVSNAVDASNYTLMEMGKPTHAYDLDKLEGGKLIVRRARPGETLTTLDGVDRKLNPEDLIIADAKKPVGLAGVMGGLDTAISTSTKNILIESAWFDPATVRKMARRLGMHTDASHIFERGADWGSTALAADRVAELILATAGGELEGDPVDVIAGHVVRHSVWLRHSEIVRHLGQDIPVAQVRRILERLGFTLYKSIEESLMKGIPAGEIVRLKSEEHREKLKARAKELGIELPDWHTNMEKDLIVDLPTWRLDVEREIDLIEEIARIYGYNKFSNTLPSFSGGVVELPNAAKEARVRAGLLALGYNEAISPTFTSPAAAETFSGSTPVILENPLSEEQSAMRTSLLSGMLDMLAWNLNRGASDVRLFEIGHTFGLTGEKSDEKTMLSMGATGNAIEASVHGAARAYSFFDLKGDVEALLGTFEARNLFFDAHTAGHFHPGRSARAVMDGTTVAQFGELHPSVAAARKLKQEVYIAEVYLDRLFALRLRRPRYQPLSKFPAVDRDFSFLFSDHVSFEKIGSAVRALNIADLKSFHPVEMFRGGSVPQGKYSLLLRAQFQSAEHTLRDDEVAQWSARIIQALEGAGGTLRG
jgi:phenylalanyl-tRNA synthetase beta chain